VLRDPGDDAGLPMKLSLRSLLLGLGAVGVTVLIVSYAELVTGQIMIGFLQLPPVVVVLLFLLVLGNKAVRRLRARWATASLLCAYYNTDCEGRAALRCWLLVVGGCRSTRGLVLDRSSLSSAPERREAGVQGA